MVSRWLRRNRQPAPDVTAPLAPVAYAGVVLAVSDRHVSGAVHDPARPGLRVPYQVVLPATGEVLAAGVADQFRHALGFGDNAHGLHARLSRPIDAAEQAVLEVRPAGGVALPRTTPLVTALEPVLHVAMDIVDNCNLRCPFCLYDYADTRATHLMTDATIDAALGFLPLVRDGEFWFSCLHEPTLHPRLMAFVDKVPRDLRRKLFYTTNVAKRMPPDYYAWLAASGLHHVNVSIESLQPALYERMRKGARHPIFMAGWEALLAAFARQAATDEPPPRLRYITMAYKSNLAELPGLVRYLLDERQAWQVELRYTFDVDHLPPEFRAAEFLDTEEWLWLRDQLAGYPPDRVQLFLPPSVDAVPAGGDTAAAASLPPGPVLADYYMLRLSWDGSLCAVGVQQSSRGGDAVETEILHTNVCDIGDPMGFIDGLNARAAGLPAA